MSYKSFSVDFDVNLRGIGMQLQRKFIKAYFITHITNNDNDNNDNNKYLV
jgi:hypothetical protein